MEEKKLTSKEIGRLGGLKKGANYRKYKLKDGDYRFKTPEQIEKLNKRRKYQYK
jgi:hypothetical protein